MERVLEKLIIGSRWLQAPLYIGLIGVLAIICIRFFSEFVHVTAVLWGGEESKLVLLVLSLVDLVMVANLSPVPRHGFRLGLPSNKTYQEILNTDSGTYGGTNIGNMGEVIPEPVPWHGLDHSAVITLPPLAVLWLYG